MDLQNTISVELYNLIKNKFPGFYRGSYRIAAQSSNRPAFDFEYKLIDSESEQFSEPIFLSPELSRLVERFFIDINESGKYNVIEINFLNNQSDFVKYWDQTIQDNFDKHLPKKMKGKVIPWYVNGSDYLKELTAQGADSKQQLHRWQPVGTLLEEFEIQYLSPIHHDYPQWAEERYLQLWHTHWNTYMICTQGLYKEGDNFSLGLELFLETIEKPDGFSSSWQANIVYEVGKLLPKVPDLKQRFETYKYLSVQIAMEGAPEEWSLPENDNIGVLLGIEHEEFQRRNIKFPFRPLNCKLLRPAETKMIKKLNAKGREKLVNFFNQKGNATISSLDRPSSVKDE
jgi:hypothetical protein